MILTKEHYLLIRDEGEQRVVGKARHANAAERVTAASDKRMNHAGELVRLVLLLAPLLDVDLLPAVGP